MQLRAGEYRPPDGDRNGWFVAGDGDRNGWFVAGDGDRNGWFVAGDGDVALSVMARRPVSDSGTGKRA